MLDLLMVFQNLVKGLGWGQGAAAAGADYCGGEGRGFTGNFKSISSSPQLAEIILAGNYIFALASERLLCHPPRSHKHAV